MSVMGMPVSWWWIAVIVGAAVFLVLFFRLHERNVFLKGRKPRSLVDIYALVKDQISFQVFEEVWLKIGQAYSIDPKLIRPEDKMMSLSKIDSWDLDKGAQEVDKWLQDNGLNLQILPPTLTILDIAKRVQSLRTNLN